MVKDTSAPAWHLSGLRIFGNMIRIRTHGLRKQILEEQPEMEQLPSALVTKAIWEQETLSVLIQIFGNTILLQIPGHRRRTYPVNPVREPLVSALETKDTLVLAPTMRHS